MGNDSQVVRLLVTGRMVGWAKARVPVPLYHGIRLGWHQLTGAIDRIGLRRLAWRWRLPTEVAHWDIWLRSRGMSDPAQFALDPSEFARRTMPDQPLQEHLRKLLPAESNGRTYRVLDIGAGPLTTVGKVCDRRTLDLVCIDPLASTYDALLEAIGVTPPVRTEYGEAERVAEMYPENSFDLVHAVNSLDHAHDPVAAIKAAVRVVKPGGYVYLAHHVNEGERERYGGLHQWNFGSQGDLFTITSKTGQVTNMTEALAGVAHVSHQILHSGIIIAAQILKIGSEEPIDRGVATADLALSRADRVP
jgi:SAM-dependent methyltransferase